MTHREEILTYLDTLLNVSEFDDYCINGLQVEGKNEISTIILGVSVSARLFEEAVTRNADMIIVHHGLFWKNDPVPYSVTGINRNRLALLLKNDINLVAFHLPLDAHSKIGNNARIINKLGYNILDPVDVGFTAQINHPISFADFVELVNEKLAIKSIAFPFGKKNVTKFLTISGGSAYLYQSAIDNEADTFIIGEIKESLVRPIEEVKLNLIVTGHYNSEKYGIQALGENLQEKFDISCKFIDIPNPI